ncbi:cold shock domain-containing protein [Streptomyces sp. NPDC013157]|uniref:cold shock domain-containing protein n=1 Tax=Streptomyces sp. NPDC013157 TaxID=3364861 RepID=UPI003684A2F9
MRLLRAQCAADGSIQQDGGGPDAFAHYSNINVSGFRELQEGQAVTFDITQGQKDAHPARRAAGRPPVTGQGRS